MNVPKITFRIIWGILNLIQVLLGIGFFAYACRLMVVTKTPLQSLITFKTYMKWEFIILIICFGSGAVLSIHGVIGLCVLFKQSKILTKFYASISVILILTMVAVAVLMAVYKTQIIKIFETRVNKSLVEDFDGYFTKNSHQFTLDFTMLMITLRCCGVYGPSDFENTIKVWNNKVKTPAGCCKYNTTFAQQIVVAESYEKFSKHLLDKDCYTEKHLGNENITHVIGCGKRIVQIDKNMPLGLVSVVLCFILFLVLSLIMHVIVGKGPAPAKIEELDKIKVKQPGEIKVQQPGEIKVEQPGEIKVEQPGEIKVEQPGEMKGELMDKIKIGQ